SLSRPDRKERVGRVAEVRAPGGEEGTRGDLQRREQDQAGKAAKSFAAAYGAKHPKAAAKITDDLQVLLAFYDYPAEHWIHLRTTNPSPPSPPCGTGRSSPADPARGRPGWPWPSSSCRRPRTAGARRTHPTWSPSSPP